jgi:hypothetical protein
VPADHLEDDTMAKAIFGYLNGPDPRAVANVAADNRRLRDRVADLEALVSRLQQENDALAAAAMDGSTLLTVPEQMQPA